jgi:hypothetical protein
MSRHDQAVPAVVSGPGDDDYTRSPGVAAEPFPNEDVGRSATRVFHQ